MNWDEVVRVHGGQAGVGVKDGIVKSLLVAQGSGHDDKVVEDKILYSVPKRASYQKAIDALNATYKSRGSFRVFKKRAVNDWDDIGAHAIVAVVEEGGALVFHLRPAKP